MPAQDPHHQRRAKPFNVAVKGGEAAIRNTPPACTRRPAPAVRSRGPDIGPDQIAAARLAGIAESTASWRQARSIKGARALAVQRQALGDLIEAIFLVARLRPTLQRQEK